MEHHAVLVDQEVVVGPGQAGADMSVDEVGPALVRDQTIQGSNFAADLPFLRLATDKRGKHGGDVHRCGPWV